MAAEKTDSKISGFSKVKASKSRSSKSVTTRSTGVSEIQRKPSIKKSFNIFEETISSQTEAGKKNLRTLIQECGADMRCHCIKTLLRSHSPASEEPTTDLESSGSDSSLDTRLTTQQIPLSIAERRQAQLHPLKLFKKRVDRTWHKRYNYVLPEDQQFDLQPYDEIQARDEGWSLYTISS
ncbi:hypothetical protein ElyMa_006668400 [Elysia marginata]|uniref:Uncharacterized protein n=1 Tax=Elysia marginata TaxID=1093978 RepID=A0AAV4INA5_9GAST|nr:hypothetical protein ElyMa_006668400 [Elysia marginata]